MKQAFRQAYSCKNSARDVEQVPDVFALFGNVHMPGLLARLAATVTTTQFLQEVHM